MKETSNNPYEALERLFHEPNRLSIMSALCAAESGLAFGDLKEACNLTDGNLNRHLKALEEAGAIRIQKTFVGSKPRTTVLLSKTGLDRFSEYLGALEEVLQKARGSFPAANRKARELPLTSARPVRAS